MPLLSRVFRLGLVVAGLIASVIPANATERARVIILGSGTPIPDPSSSGPCVAIVLNGQAYLFDAGVGIVRQAEAAAEKLAVPALDATRLSRLFITHLHSDHTLGYPDVILTPWVVGRSEPLEVYGPKGLAAMTDHLKAAYAADIQVRTGGLEERSGDGLKVNVHEIDGPGVVYKDDNVIVRSIQVKHGSWAQAFGYVIEAGGRRIVISGDTSPTQAIVDACRGCDVLLHEVYSDERFKLLYGESRGQYHRAFHTSTSQLAALASQAKPKILVLYHQLYFGRPDEVDLVKEIHQTYAGPVVNGRDLTEY